jgi:hypothetical protein
MTKKLVGLLVVALFCVGMANASTFSEACPPGGIVQGPGTPGISGNSVCAAFTVPMGDTLTSVEIFISGDWSLGVTGGNTLNYTYTITGGTPAFTPSTLTESVQGNQGFSSAFIFAGCPEVGGSDTAACTQNLSLNGLATYASVVVTGVGSWAAGSAGLSPTGAEDFGVVSVIFTYGPTVTTPEPASLLMIGGGLIGLAVFARRKRKV